MFLVFWLLQCVPLGLGWGCRGVYIAGEVPFRNNNDTNNNGNNDNNTNNVVI
jgi:hypothetical protein